MPVTLKYCQSDADISELGSTRIGLRNRATLFRKRDAGGTTAQNLFSEPRRLTGLVPLIASSTFLKTFNFASTPFHLLTFALGSLMGETERRERRTGLWEALGLARARGLG